MSQGILSPVLQMQQNARQPDVFAEASPAQQRVLATMDAIKGGGPEAQQALHTVWNELAPAEQQVFAQKLDALAKEGGPGGAMAAQFLSSVNGAYVAPPVSDGFDRSASAQTSPAMSGVTELLLQFATHLASPEAAQALRDIHAARSQANKP